MPYKLECAQSFSSEDASEADINQAFDDDRIRGEFIILTASDGSFIQAAGEGDGPYALEYREEGASKNYQAVEEFTKEQVRVAFLEYLRGDPGWRSRQDWKPVKSSGCLPTIVFAVVLGGALALSVG